MSNIRYPNNDTLSNLIRSNMNSLISDLNDAKSDCYFDPPGDFSYRNYVLNLENLIDSYKSRARAIYSTVENIDRSYRNMRDSVNSITDRINTKVIEKRDKIVR